MLACLQHSSGSVPMAASPKSTTVVVISTRWPTCESPSVFASHTALPYVPNVFRDWSLVLVPALYPPHPSYEMMFIWLRFLTLRDETIYMS